MPIIGHALGEERMGGHFERPSPYQAQLPAPMLLRGRPMAVRLRDCARRVEWCTRGGDAAPCAGGERTGGLWLPLSHTVGDGH